MCYELLQNRILYISFFLSVYEGAGPQTIFWHHLDLEHARKLVHNKRGTITIGAEKFIKKKIPSSLKMQLRSLPMCLGMQNTTTNSSCSSATTIASSYC